MIWRFAAVHLGLSVIFIGVSAYFWGLNAIPSSAFGALLIGINLAGLIWAWRRIFLKKGIAFAISVIVLKYPLIAAFIYIALSKEWVMAYPFALGVATLIPNIVMMSVWKEKLVGLE